MDGGLLAQAPQDSFYCGPDQGTTGPYYGSCCTRLHCYQPSNGSCADPVQPYGALGLTPPLPPGSGTCMCTALMGPFAQPDGGTTECCYVAGSIGCLGRPLRDGEATLVAAVVARSDWA